MIRSVYAALDRYPSAKGAATHIDQVDRIYTAAGANSIRQLAHFGDRHVTVQLERPLDNQRRRVDERIRNRPRKQEPCTEFIAS